MVFKSAGLASGTGGGTGGGIVSINSDTTSAQIIAAGSGISVGTAAGTTTISAIGGGSGTVTNVSGVTANGFSFSIANPTTTPAITLQTTVNGILQGSGTAVSAVSVGNNLNFSGGGLVAIPSGSSGQLQYNNSGSFSGDTATTDGSGNLTASSIAVSGSTAPNDGLYLPGGSTVGISSIGKSVARFNNPPNAVDFFQFSGASTANPATISITALGSDSNININLVTKGSGVLEYNGNPAAITIGAQTGLAGGGSVALGSAITLSMGTNIGNTLAGYNASGVFSDVSIGSNLSLSSGKLSGVIGGSNTQIQYNNNTVLGGVINATSDGSNLLVVTQNATDNSTKAASTQYVTTAITNAIAGVNPAVAVQFATTQASDTSAYTYNNGVSGVGATLTGSNNVAFTADGQTATALLQRILVKNDTQSPSGAFNGVYYVSQLQTAILPPILTRALDYDQPSDINNTGAIPVVNGTLNASTSWLLTSSVTTVGTDPLTYTKFSINPTTILTNTLTTGHVFIGNGSSIATDTAMSGDVSIISTGATAIQAVQGNTVVGTTGVGAVAFASNPTFTNLSANGTENLYFVSQNNFSGGISVNKRGNNSSSTGAISNTAELGYNSFYGWDGSGYQRGAYVIAHAAESWGTTNHGTQYEIYITAVGTVANTLALLINNAGNITTGTWNATPIANAFIANPQVTVSGVSGVTGGGIVALGAAITLGMAGSTANTLAGYDNNGAFSDVAIGSNLSLSGGVLTATAGSGAVSSVFGRTGAVTAQWNDYQFNLIGGTATVSQGGTGQTSLTSHSVLLGEGAVTGVGFATTGTAGRLLIDQGGVDPAFKIVTGDVSINSAGATTIQAASVTYAKMQNEAIYTVLGNNTGSVGSTAAISTIIMGTPGYTPSGYSFEQYTGNTNSYAQISLQNSSAGSSASVDFILTANDGNDTTHYADFGMNNSVTGGAAFTNPHAAYVYSTDNELDLAALGASGQINFYTTGGVNTPTIAGFFDSAQKLHLASALSTAFGGTSNTTYTSGQLLVGNASGTLTPSTISAGTSISITNGSGIVGITYTGSATGVSTITNSDGSLTISPQTGVAIASLNSAHSNTWSAQQTYSAGVVQTPVALVITASVITTNASVGNYFYVQLVAGTSTLTNPTNPSDSQVITYELQQPSSGSLGLIAVGSAYDYGTSGAVTLTSGASKIDLIGFRYSSRNNKWNYLGSQLGF